MARKKAEIEEVKEKVSKKVNVPAPELRPVPETEKYRAISNIYHQDSVYKPGDILNLTKPEAKLLRKQNAVVLVED